MTKTMKVRVAVTVEINVEAWMLEYGTERNEIRADVQRHIANMVRQQLDSLEVSA